MVAELLPVTGAVKATTPAIGSESVRSVVIELLVSPVMSVAVGTNCAGVSKTTE
ncbi:MAG: hypothetical protein BWY91_00806 [bacterium ADurb.BinA028]|nr:MAG: hypothetical protein BWY91_00806 [bacterium ADurb.BinA028]